MTKSKEQLNNSIEGSKLGVTIMNQNRREFAGLIAAGMVGVAGSRSLRSGQAEKGQRQER